MPMVPLGDQRLVYLGKQSEATVEASTNVVVWDVVAALGDPCGNPGYGEVGGRDLDEMKNGAISDALPLSYSGNIRSRRKRGLDSEGRSCSQRVIEAAEELPGCRDGGLKFGTLALNLVDVEEGNVRVEKRKELSSESCLSRTIGSSNDDGLRRGHCEDRRTLRPAVIDRNSATPSEPVSVVRNATYLREAQRPPNDFGVLLQGAFVSTQQVGRLSEIGAAISRHLQEA